MYLRTVSKELAIKLKELGFDWPTISYYHPSYDLCHDRLGYSDAFKGPEYFMHYNSKKWANGYYSAPTLELAKQWFREVKNIVVVPLQNASGWWCVLEKTGGTFISESLDDGPNEAGEWDSYEEALEAGLLEACNLVK